MDRLQKASFFFSIFWTIENKHTKCEEPGGVGAPWKICVQAWVGGGGGEISTPALQNFQGFSDSFSPA